MRARGVRWIGIGTDRYAEMVTFLRDVVGLRVAFAEGTTTEFETADGDAVQVMGPGDPYHAFFETHARGPVPLFEVDDVRETRTELEQAGVTVVGQIERDRSWEWIHVLAPDGNLYEFGSPLDRADPAADASDAGRDGG
jgi:catechol 2,3-dioxygenase-like lactoylglutathione lyase family enzyme